jgi:thiosulfate/3-mercaptopyruvate sulfurtransferase
MNSFLIFYIICFKAKLKIRKSQNQFILSLLTSTSELNQMLNKSEDLLLVDTRPFTEYSMGHIQGAVNIDLFQFHWLDSSKDGIRQFVRQSRILLSNIGVRNEKSVVFYDNVSGMSAARGVWLLVYFSHNRVSLLDGGFDKWKKEGHPVETNTNAYVKSNFRGKPNPRVLATVSEIERSIGKKGTMLLDARTKEEFKGIHVRAARAGHIPSAINIDWEENIKGGSFKTKEALSNLYSRIPKDSKVVTYCQGGYRAAHTFVALNILGYENVKMYLGSWGEWGNRSELPVEV